MREESEAPYGETCVCGQAWQKSETGRMREETWHLMSQEVAKVRHFMSQEVAKVRHLMSQKVAKVRHFMSQKVAGRCAS